MFMKWQLLNTTALCRAPADGQGGGDGGDGGEPGGMGEGEATGQDPGAGDAGQSQDGRTNLLDFAPKGESNAGKDGGEAWKMPDGLDIPEHLRGDSAEATLEKLNKAYKGARQQLSTRAPAEGTLAGSIPDTIEGYTFDAVEGDPTKDAVLADLTSEASKAYIDPAREVAKELGLPDATFAKFMHGYVTKLNEAGLNVSVNPEEAQQARGEAEMAALTERLGQQGADLALRQIDTFAQKLAANGILGDQDDVREFAEMVGTAKGLEIMQRIIVAEFGEQAIPRGDAVDGAPTLEEAYATHAAALSMPPGSSREEAVAAAERRLEKAMQQGSTQGAIRSRVL